MSLRWIYQPAVWLAGRIGGTKAANDVLDVVNANIAKEIKTAVPILVSDIDKIAPTLAAIADASIDFVRAKFVALVSNVNVSSDTSARLVGAITAVAAPAAENAVNNLILTFADDVKAALAKL